MGFVTVTHLGHNIAKDVGIPGPHKEEFLRPFSNTVVFDIATLERCKYEVVLNSRGVLWILETSFILYKINKSTTSVNV